MARSHIVNLANFEQFAAINVLSDGGLSPGKHVIPNCIEIALGWALDGGKLGHCILHGSRTDGLAVTQAQATAILNGLTTGAPFTALAAFWATTTNLSLVTLRDLRVLDSALVPSSGGSGLGSSASPSLPNEVAAAVTLRTTLVGPGNRGRMYVPGWATNALGAGNIIAAAAVTALQNWVNTIPTVFSGQGYTFCLKQAPRNAYTGSTGTPHPARVAGTLPFISQTVRDNHWDSQRRRGLK